MHLVVLPRCPRSSRQFLVFFISYLLLSSSTMQDVQQTLRVYKISLPEKRCQFITKSHVRTDRQRKGGGLRIGHLLWCSTKNQGRQLQDLACIKPSLNNRGRPRVVDIKTVKKQLRWWHLYKDCLTNFSTSVFLLNNFWFFQLSIWGENNGILKPHVFWKR